LHFQRGFQKPNVNLFVRGLNRELLHFRGIFAVAREVAPFVFESLRLSDRVCPGAAE
jgi:hypothetical protein